jgi:hypothetical protein
VPYTSAARLFHALYRQPALLLQQQDWTQQYRWEHCRTCDLSSSAWLCISLVHAGAASWYETQMCRCCVIGNDRWTIMSTSIQRQLAAHVTGSTSMRTLRTSAILLRVAATLFTACAVLLSNRVVLHFETMLAAPHAWYASLPCVTATVVLLPAVCSTRT